MRKLVCFFTVVLVVVGIGLPAHSGLRGPSKERQDKSEQKKLAREKEMSNMREARLKSHDPEIRQEASLREREFMDKQEREKRREMKGDQRRGATDDEIEKKLRSVRQSVRDLDIKNRAAREADGDRERGLDRRNNFEQQDRRVRGNDDIPRGRSNDDVPRGRPNEDATRARSDRDDGADVMRRGWEEDQRGMAESRRRMQKAMDEDMKYSRRINGDEDVVRASKTGIDSYKKNMAGKNYGEPEVDARLDMKVKELLSNPGARINDDGSVTVNNRAGGQPAKARNGSAQTSRSSRSTSSGRTFSSAQIKAIYAKGDD